jgi:hypothetical protein
MMYTVQHTLDRIVYKQPNNSACTASSVLANVRLILIAAVIQSYYRQLMFNCALAVAWQ